MIDTSHEEYFYGDVLIPSLIDRPFTYCFEEKITPGTFVHVPWRNKIVTGVVWAQTFSIPKEIVIKRGAIISIPPLSRSVLSFVGKLSAYNLIPLGWVLRMVLGGVDVLKAFADTPQKKRRQDYDVSLEKVRLYDLSLQQKECAQTIDKALEKNAYQAFLLEGLTGSGKTEVYFQGIHTALKQHKQILVLLPEIGLTQAWFERFKKQFGFLPHVWHTHTTPLQRRDIWKKALVGESMIVVGARSALFLPFANLGFMIVDEEHDASFKQDEQGCYHGRDMAMLRASMAQHPIVLASATPSLEIVDNVRQKKCISLCLSERFGGATLPTIHVVDRRKKANKREQTASPWLSTILVQGIHERLQKGEQSLLFLNRKGYAPVTLCTSCGYRYVCVACSSTLVQHKEKERHFLQCHYCGFKKVMDKACPECQDVDSFHACGPGLDRLTEDVALCFPKARVAALSSDLSLKKQRDIWDSIYRGDVDILLGTQILAKGHHLPLLTLVGVIDGDSGLYGSDLRGSEKTFQLLHQVSGRSGREDRVGTVLIQTYQPDHPLFKALQTHDFQGFVEKELALRHSLSLPPYTRLTSVLLSGKNESLVEYTAKNIASCFYHAMIPLTKNQQESIKVLGPAPAFMARVNHHYRYRLLIKTPKRMNSSQWIQNIIHDIKIPSTVRLMIDVDPVDFM